MQAQRTDLITDDTIAAYLADPPPECREFDFLIGDWELVTTRYDRDGTAKLLHRGRWSARHLAGGRIVLDETITLRQDGTEIASMATLRTYSPVTGRWEMTFVSAHQPVLPISFVGRRVDEELQLEVRPAANPEGPLLARVRFFDIRDDRFAWEQHTSVASGERFERTVSIRARRIHP